MVVQPCYHIIVKGTQPGKRQKGEQMQEVMTDFQFKALIKLVLDILNGSSTKEEAAKKLQELLDEGKK